MSTLAHRKSTARLLVLNPDGTPAAGRRVQLDQVSHQFLFGCGATEAEAIARAQTEEDRLFHEQLAEKWLKLFNYGTLHFYWGRFEPVEGKTEKEAQMKAARWLKDRGVVTKGHPLCWHTACADWLMQYPNDEILRRQIARVHRDVTEFRGLVDKWDVINEVVIMPVFDKYDNAITRICQDYGQVPLVKAVFDAAKQSNPDATLLINDFNTSEDYAHLLEDLLEAGVPITAIGIQSHQHQGYWGLEKLHAVLGRFSRFNLPIHFTENTLISGELMPPEIVDLNDWQVTDWPTTPEGEERQAKQVTEMYSVLFEHPLVEAITTWDFTDRCWLNAPAGFLRKDGSEKPVYFALHDLIHGAWETHEEAVTDSEGCIDFTGFKGGYKAVTENGEAAFCLKNDKPQTLILK